MKALVIGSSGAVGRAAVGALRTYDVDVVEASRSGEHRIDITNEESIRALFEQVGEVDAVVCTAGATVFKPFEQLTREDFLSGFLSKVQGQIDLVRIGTPYVRDGGSFTLTSGILTRVPIATGVAASAANGAVESFVVAAATELPRGIRINVVSATVLADSPGYHAAFPGFVPVASPTVGAAYVRSVLGVRTGCVEEAYA